MDTGTLKTILLEEMQKYAGEGLNAYSYFTANEAEQLYTVVDIANVRGKRIIGTVLVVRLQADQIIIRVGINAGRVVKGSGDIYIAGIVDCHITALIRTGSTDGLAPDISVGGIPLDQEQIVRTF